MSVTKLKSCDRWQSQGRYFGKRVYHGLYKTRERAMVEEARYRVESLEKELGYQRILLGQMLERGWGVKE